MPPAAQQDTLAYAILTLQSLHNTYLSPALPQPLNTLVSTLLSSAVQAQPYVSSFVSSASTLYDNVTRSNESKSARGSAMVTASLFILTVYLGLRIMNYVRKTIVGWVLLGIKLVLVLVMVQVALYVNTYGWEKAVRDASWWGGIVWGFAEDLFGEQKQQKVPPRGMRSRAQVPAGRGANAGRTRWT